MKDDGNTYIPLEKKKIEITKIKKIQYWIIYLIIRTLISISIY
jgi:hypothetical protein